MKKAKRKNEIIPLSVIVGEYLECQTLRSFENCNVASRFMLPTNTLSHTLNRCLRTFFLDTVDCSRGSARCVPLSQSGRPVTPYYISKEKRFTFSFHTFCIRTQWADFQRRKPNEINRKRTVGVDGKRKIYDYDLLAPSAFFHVLLPFNRRRRCQYSVHNLFGWVSVAAILPVSSFAPRVHLPVRSLMARIEQKHISHPSEVSERRSEQQWRAYLRMCYFNFHYILSLEAKLLRSFLFVASSFARNAISFSPLFVFVQQTVWFRSTVRRDHQNSDFQFLLLNAQRPNAYKCKKGYISVLAFI